MRFFALSRHGAPTGPAASDKGVTPSSRSKVMIALSADHMRTELVLDALKAAAATRGSLTGAIFHSDHGSVYTSKDYARLCTELGVTQSMGAVGTCLLTGQSDRWGLAA